ncbi:hypothetical protein B0H13DRAFT_2672974 [Mycena leptocephala]|nr:hypothetical protein B0H13DRAFT_2672974 [Mycena leptocephala]
MNDSPWHPDVLVKQEQHNPPSVPLKRKDLRYLQPEVDSHSYNPFSEPQHQLPLTHGIVVTGMPGIGKSIFARYVLALRCMVNLPTVFIDHPNYMDIYNNNQVRTVVLHRAFLRDIPTSTWIIVDCNQELQTVPQSVFKTRAFIMQVMSPHEAHAEWVKKRLPRAGLLAMEAWSAEELIAAQSAQGTEDTQLIESQQLVHFVERFGGSARDAYAFAEEPGAYEEQLGIAFGQVTALSMSAVIEGEILPRFAKAEISHTILSIFPRDNGGVRDMVMKAPTAHVHSLLIAHIERKESEARNQIWRTFLGHPLGKFIAGNLLDRNFHRVLLDGAAWPLFPMDVRALRRANPANYHVMSVPASDPTIFLSLQGKLFIHAGRLLNSPHRLPLRKFSVGDSDNRSLEEHVYYQPISADFGTFDSFVIISPDTAVVFQASVGERHRNHPAGLKWLKDHGIRQIVYVIVTPSGSEMDLTFPTYLLDDNIVTELYHLPLSHI